MTEELPIRLADPNAAVVDLSGDVTAELEQPLMAAYAHASARGAQAIVLNFDDVSYMNSGGIGLLVTLLVRANRHGQRLLTVGLSEHYRRIFALTRLNEAIGIFDNEAEALAAV